MPLSKEALGFCDWPQVILGADGVHHSLLLTGLAPWGGPSVGICWGPGLSYKRGSMFDVLFVLDLLPEVCWLSVYDAYTICGVLRCIWNELCLFWRVVVLFVRCETASAGWLRCTQNSNDILVKMLVDLVVTTCRPPFGVFQSLVPYVQYGTKTQSPLETLRISCIRDL